MNWTTFTNQYLAELADVFSTEHAAQTLLESVGFPRRHLPTWDESAAAFWHQAAHEVNNGLVQGGLGVLVRAAADRYPHNQVFNQAQQTGAQPQASAPQVQPDSGTSLIVTGGELQVHQLIDRARALAAGLGISGAVELGYANPDNVQLRLPEAEAEQTLQLGNRLREEGLAERVTVISANRFRDYLLHRLFVEGPDQGRYELSDIPASTTNKDVVRAVMGQYYGETWPTDRGGRSRPAVIDRVEQDGSHTRLEPTSTLHESGVREGDTLAVAPESTAGGVSPLIREEALARVRSQVVHYAEHHPGFVVEANAQIAPTEYLFRFRAPGWGPPGGHGGEPRPVDKHEVLLLLPPDFPMQAPAAYWQTPIFHPNVHRKSGKVCLGVLEDRYRPGLDFAELCQILVDIARYKNYEIREGYDQEARQWAVSRDGQIAIERRGGVSITRLLLSMVDDHKREPLPVRMKRLEEGAEQA